jgi:diamine N-acetyltransferase
MNPDFLTGIHIMLRALEPGDAGLLYQWENDPSVWEVSNTLIPFSRFQIEEYVLNAQQDIFTSRQLRLMIDLLQVTGGERSIGTLDLFDFDPLHRRAGVGILIRQPYREMGYATEAMKLFIRYAFGTLHLHQLFCNISEDNMASIRLFENLGFERGGIRKDWHYDGNKWNDVGMYQLIHHNG